MQLPTMPDQKVRGQILADITKDRKVKNLAVTHTNNDYGKGLADVYVAAVKAHGGCQWRSYFL